MLMFVMFVTYLFRILIKLGLCINKGLKSVVSLSNQSLKRYRNRAVSYNRIARTNQITVLRNEPRKQFVCFLSNALGALTDFTNKVARAPTT